MQVDSTCVVSYMNVFSPSLLMIAGFEKVTYRPQENQIVLLPHPRRTISRMDLSSLTLKISHSSDVWSLAMTSHPLEKQNEYINTCAIFYQKDCLNFSVYKIIFTNTHFTYKRNKESSKKYLLIFEKILNAITSSNKQYSRQLKLVLEERSKFAVNCLYPMHLLELKLKCLSRG